MKQRIWELDALRGICILGMVLVHFVYDLTSLYGILDIQIPEWFLFVQNWGGLLFLLISGISATLGNRSVRRGLIVLVAGVPVCLVTYVMYRYLHFTKDIIIYFGVLQCLGCCMIAWWLFRRLPSWVLIVVGATMIAVGMYLRGTTLVNFPWLIPLGFTYPGFASSDYFPLLPNLGFFLWGAALGRWIYCKKQSLLPHVSADNPIRRVLCFCGRQSLWIYLLHQPVLAGICMLLQ